MKRSNATILKVEDLVKDYPGKRVLDGVSFEAKAGQVIVLMGGSGAGKSTIFRCIIGATPITQGRVWIDGRDMAAVKNERERDQLRKTFGVAFQQGALFNSMTVSENVALPLKYHTRLDNDTIKIIVKIKLEQVGLRDAGDLFPSEISGGMQKRAAFARAMALDPKIVFFDEPSAGLDPIVVAVIDELISDFAKKMGVTCIVITHELKSAFRIADRILMLHQGQILASGSPDEIRDSPDPIIQQFIQGQPDGPIPRNATSKDFMADILEI